MLDGGHHDPVRDLVDLAITELAGSISTLTDRKFQVIGHSDSTPIRTARFESSAQEKEHEVVVCQIPKDTFKYIGRSVELAIGQRHQSKHE